MSPRSRMGHPGWPAMILAGVLAVALGTAGCSDDEPANGGDPDAVSDAATDVADVSSPDLVDEVGVDTGEDPTTDPSGDVADDPRVDAVEDAPVDAAADTAPDDQGGFVDVGDQGTTEFEVCPYEPSAVSIECGDMCDALVACTDASVEPVCLAFCAGAELLMNASGASRFATCIEECDSEVADPGAECLFELTDGMDENVTMTAACEAVGEAVDECGGEASVVERCILFAPALRDEVAPVLQACATEACEDIENCVRAAFCDILPLR